MNQDNPIPSTGGDVQAVEKLHQTYQRVTGQLGGVIVGMEDVIEQMLVVILCRGHGMLEGSARLGEDPLGIHRRVPLKSDLPKDPVHARPDAVRYHRHRHFGGGPYDREADLPVCQRPNFWEYHPG